MTLLECRPGRKVRLSPEREGWILYANQAGPQWRAEPQTVTVQYWSSARFQWLTEQCAPEQLSPVPERATDDVPGRPA